MGDERGDGLGRVLRILAVAALTSIAGATPGHAFRPAEQTVPPRIAPQPAPARVIFETAPGNITMEVDLARAPITAANFLKYVTLGKPGGSDFAFRFTPAIDVNRCAIQTHQTGTFNGFGGLTSAKCSGVSGACWRSGNVMRRR
jgi:hypothetical protein